MPLHLGAFFDGKKRVSLLAGILSQADSCESAFAAPDKRKFHMCKDLFDEYTGKMIGQISFSLAEQTNPPSYEIKDLSITLENEKPCSLEFLRRVEGEETEAEYYECNVDGRDAHLNVEVVNRLAQPEGELTGIIPTHLSLFPFELSVYDDIDAFNRWAGFSEAVDIAGIGLKMSGFSDVFVMPGQALSDDVEKDAYTFAVGTVDSFRDVRIDFGETKLDFVLANVKTAMGVVPVAIGRENFDLRELEIGKLVAMNVYVEADVAAPGQFLRAQVKT